MGWRFSLYDILPRILSYFRGKRWDEGSVYMIFYPEFYDISEGRDGTKVQFISYFTQNFMIFQREEMGRRLGETGPGLQ